MSYCLKSQSESQFMRYTYSVISHNVKNYIIFVLSFRQLHFSLQLMTYSTHTTAEEFYHESHHIYITYIHIYDQLYLTRNSATNSCVSSPNI